MMLIGSNWKMPSNKLICQVSSMEKLPQKNTIISFQYVKTHQNFMFPTNAQQFPGKAKFQGIGES